MFGRKEVHECLENIVSLFGHLQAEPACELERFVSIGLFVVVLGDVLGIHIADILLEVCNAVAPDQVVLIHVFFYISLEGSSVLVFHYIFKEALVRHGECADEILEFLPFILSKSHLVFRSLLLLESSTVCSDVVSAESVVSDVFGDVLVFHEFVQVGITAEGPVVRGPGGELDLLDQLHVFDGTHLGVYDCFALQEGLVEAGVYARAHGVHEARFFGWRTGVGFPCFNNCIRC